LFIVGIWFRAVRPKKLRIQVLRFVPDGTRIPFMKLARPAIIISLIACVFSIGSVAVQGFNFGIDFKGGSAIEVKHLNGPADPGAIREHLSALGLGDVQVQGFGTPEDVLIRVEAQPGGDMAQQEAVTKVQNALSSDNYEVRRVEIVGPSVSGELTVSGTIALLVSLVAILIYVWFRFEWQFAVGAIIATVHDVILTIGLFSLTGIEFNLTSIAAILTVVGLSLNDTVVVYDRVRENLRKYKKMPLPELIDLSINSTLARTTLTSFTTFLALIPLVLFGGEVLRGFTIAMTWGVFVGTYSSIVIAAPILIAFGLRSRSDMPAEKPAEKPADGAAV
jgi:SecD/SecF fusion protein